MTTHAYIKQVYRQLVAALACAATLFLSACSSISEVEHINYYRLDQKSANNALVADTPKYLFVKVDLPHLTTTHSNDAILYSEAPLKQDAYSKSQWAVPLPTMLQDWLIENLDTMGLFKGVVRTSSRASATYLIETDVIQFEHIVYENMAAIALRISLLDINSRRLIKQKTFRYQQPFEEQSAGNAVNAFNQSMQQFNRDLFVWLDTS